ncbi:hypothetical protein [Streptomyces sp. RTd22]|uniref:hypothetical protein n=1 Tax=Streptomyces sp. RTd22 TaxID=1841249 RepID=UPI00131A7CD8|nr:hypothetical protein [Streptomyces sp. RTd22]
MRSVPLSAGGVAVAGGIPLPAALFAWLPVLPMAAMTAFECAAHLPRRGASERRQVNDDAR